jgi:hypothetical protein
MPIKHGKPNPLNLLGLRRVQFPARHFHFITLPKYSPGVVKSVDEWIYNNLNGRYYVGQGISLDHTNTIVYVTKIGFEQEKEKSFFLLSYSNL